MVTTSEPNIAFSSQRVRAPVVDSRVAGVVDTHHWIHVNASFARAFERAAAANAGVTAVVEARAGTPARRRWVLHRVADPSLEFLDGTFTTDAVTYVVMEQYDTPTGTQDVAHTHRWLSAVKKVGPMLGAIDIATLTYDSVFSARRHNAMPTQENAIVVIESFNAKNAREMRAILQETAEAAVQAGECLEYSVLQAQGSAFFKTVEVYQDVEALKNSRSARVHRALERRLVGKVVGEHRERQTFKATHLA